jgi:hypothetical protein
MSSLVLDIPLIPGSSLVSQSTPGTNNLATGCVPLGALEPPDVGRHIGGSDALDLVQ